MPAAKIELGHGYESLYRVFDFSQREERFWMGHETVQLLASREVVERLALRNALCDALQHGSRLEDEGGQRYSAQIGAWPQLRNDVCEHFAEDSLVSQISGVLRNLPCLRGHILLPCSGSKAVSSPLVASSWRVSSMEEPRLPAGAKHEH